MTRKRSTEIWHIPKRGSIHQIIGALNVIHANEIDGKPWPSYRKKFDQKFAMWGFTKNGRSINRNASETLEALLKYLGLLVVVNEKLYITPAGMALIKEHPIKPPSIMKRRLKDTIRAIGIIHSKVLTEQMIKLVLTNPTISTYCTNILVSPFRETLLLLLDNDIRYLTYDEMGYILFHMRCRSERDKIKERIMNFRKLSEVQRTTIIGEYKKTPEGNLTITQAPFTAYWSQMCENTGLCEAKGKKLYLVNGKESQLNQLLYEYPDYCYDFGTNIDLWYRYYTVPEQKHQPIDAKIVVEIK